MLVIRLFYSSYCRGVKWYLIVVLMRISQRTNVVEHLFMILLAKEKCVQGNSLVVQWLGLSTFTAMGLRSIPGHQTKILQASWHSKKKKRERKKSVFRSFAHFLIVLFVFLLSCKSSLYILLDRYKSLMR